MRIEVNNGIAKIHTSYNPDFVKKIKKIGGAKWDYEDKCWKVPASAVDTVRQFMKDVYGYSDIEKNETISLKVTFDQEASSKCSDVVLFGKVIAHASGRDSGARIGDDVAFRSGDASSGGSRATWYSIVEKGSVVILSNVNKNVYEKEKNTKGITVEVIDTTVDRQKLVEEKERLQRRIADIEKMLQEVV